MSKHNSQANRLLRHFQAGKSITRLESFRELGITELSARINALEKQGYEIQRETITVKNRFGEDCRVKKYWMESAEGQSELFGIAAEVARPPHLNTL